MNELTLLKRFILNAPAKNSEHIEAISWVNSIERQIKQLEAQAKQSTQDKKIKNDGK